jgi:DNA-binding XRE family transcriptional regulator
MGEVIRFPSASHAEPVEAPRQARRAEVEPLWREVAGDELRRERQQAERTLADVAERAGISVQYLSEVERGLKEPSSEVVAAVAGALGLRLADLTLRVARRLHGPVCLAA